MKSIAELTNVKHFTCGCGREWGFWEDKDTSGELKETYRKIHDCNTVTIYAKPKSLSRHFVKKIK